MCHKISLQRPEVPPLLLEEGKDKGEGGHSFSPHLKLVIWLTAPFLLIFISSCAVSTYDHTYASYRRAILRGEIRQALAASESQALEAEKMAAASWFPERYWKAANRAYSQALRMAKLIGQLQKAITYGDKALLMAEQTKDPVDQAQAIYVLIDAHRAVGNFDKVRELLERGLRIVQDIPPNTNARTNYEDVFYRRLALDLMRRKEYEKAIDASSQSLQLANDYMTNISRTRNRTRIENAKTTVIGRLTALGTAYRHAGKLQAALEQYQRALEVIKEWGLKYQHEGSLYRRMGEVYVRQKNLPKALESYQHALAIAEAQQRPGCD